MLPWGPKPDMLSANEINSPDRLLLEREMAENMAALMHHSQDPAVPSAFSPLDAFLTRLNWEHYQLTTTQGDDKNRGLDYHGFLKDSRVLHPGVMAVLPEDRQGLLVIDRLTYTLRRFLVEDRTFQDVPFALNSPGGVFPSPEGSLWVCDKLAGELICLDHLYKVTKTVSLQSLRRLATHPYPITGCATHDYLFILTTDDKQTSRGVLILEAGGDHRVVDFINLAEADIFPMTIHASDSGNLWFGNYSPIMFFRYSLPERKLRFGYKIFFPGRLRSAVIINRELFLACGGCVLRSTLRGKIQKVYFLPQLTGQPEAVPLALAGLERDGQNLLLVSDLQQGGIHEFIVREIARP